MTALTPELVAEAQGLLDRLKAILGMLGVPPVQPAPTVLTEADYADAALALSTDLATVQAIKSVESNGHGFAADGRPIILFEPHVFSRLTGHRYDATQGGVSYPVWGAKPYPKTQAARWDQLLYAANLDHDAAYQSASYGLFQIMGFNFAACGFATISAFVAAMAQGERQQLLAFVAFVTANHLAPSLRARNWAAFAAGYNGPGQVDAYSAKLATAYETAKSPTTA